MRPGTDAARCIWIALCLSLCAGVLPASADAVLLLAEPYGRSGTLNPTGHVGVYLTRVCADTPTVLRRCPEGESGAVVSRYNKVAGLDWAAIPLLPYLYAVERVADVPTVVTPEQVRDLRETYRREHLRHLVPDTMAGADRHWMQLAGAVYDSSIDRVFRADDRRTGRPPYRRTESARQHATIQLFFRNCADFARDLINGYFYRKAISKQRDRRPGADNPQADRQGACTVRSAPSGSSISGVRHPADPRQSSAE